MTFNLPAQGFLRAEIVAPPPDDGREVEISFSSESPVLRADPESGKPFLEVLGHAPGEVDLARLNSGGAPLLKDHVPTIDAQIGVVVRAWIEAGRGRAVVRFARNPASQDVLDRVRSGDVTCVSVGYGIAGAKRDGAADGVPIVRVTSWTPREISFVAIPADQSVGYGRAADPAAAETIQVTEENAMTPEEIAAAAAKADKAAARAADPAADRGAVRDALSAERARVSEIEAIASVHSVPADLVRAARDDGHSAAQFRAAVLDHLSSKPAEATRAGATMIGLSEGERNAFSMVKLLRHLSSPEERRFREAAAFELEVVTAAGDAKRGEVRGVVIPADVTSAMIGATRASDQLKAPLAKGGFTVDEVLMSGSMIDILRATSILPRLGARVFAGLEGDVAFPKQLTDVSYSWVAEDGSATKSGITFGQVKMTPKTIAAMTEISRKLLIQSSIDVEAYVRQSIMSTVALGIDAAGIGNDTSANAPKGLTSALLASGSKIHRGDFAGEAGPTYKEAVALRTRVKLANALQGNLAYALGPVMEEHLLTSPKFDGGEIPIMAEEGRLNGYRAEGSNQVADGGLWFGNWSDLYMGLWSGLDILVDPYSNSASGAVRIVAHQDVDFAIAREESFAYGEVTPAP